MRNSTVLVPSNSVLLFNASPVNKGMENKDIRRANLLALIEKHGGTSALAALVDVDPTYLGNIKNRVKTPSGRERGMGEDTARRIESKLGLQNGWMDVLHSTGAEHKVEQELVEYFRRSPPKWKAVILETAKSAGSPEQPDPSAGHQELSADPPLADGVRTPDEKKKSKVRRSP